MQTGGLLVVPAAPALKNIPDDLAYRKALQGADVVITDSAFMVIIWNLLQHDSIRRVSGLKYLALLLKQPQLNIPGNSFWIMASEASAQTNCAWLARQGIRVSELDRYIAPVYGKMLEDPGLLQRIQQRRPRHVVVTIGGGTQERLGLYLKQNLEYKPAIHCVGAAIAFLSGDQVRIPRWADRFYLGWLFRVISNPPRYMPRYWDARKLYLLMKKYGSELPDSLDGPPLARAEAVIPLNPSLPAADKALPSPPAATPKQDSALSSDQSIVTASQR